MPTEIYKNSIILTHWGRMDVEHKSGTAFSRDNYNHEVEDPHFQPKGWTRLIDGHPCYNASKDLVIPSLKLPEHYRTSPLLGGYREGGEREMTVESFYVSGRGSQ